jgi:hypothetical protein
VQVRTKGDRSAVTGRPTQSVAMARPTYFSVLEEQAGRIKEVQSRRMLKQLMRCVCSVQEGGIIVENGALALSRTPVWVLAGAPACLGTRPVGDVIGQSPGTA